MRFLLLSLLLLSCQPAERPVPVAPASSVPAPVPSGPTVLVGDRRISVEIADTYASREKGLSGRASLAPGTGLVLLWPDQPKVMQIWMPDMNFPIDVIFVRDRTVVALYENAQPCPKDGPCPTFGPDMAVNYVLEVPAGSAKAWGLKEQDSIELKR